MKMSQKPCFIFTVDVTYISSFAETVVVEDPEEEKESRKEEETEQEVLQAHQVGGGETSPRSTEIFDDFFENLIQFFKKRTKDFCNYYWLKLQFKSINLTFMLINPYFSFPIWVIGQNTINDII